MILDDILKNRINLKNATISGSIPFSINDEQAARNKRYDSIRRFIVDTIGLWKYIKEDGKEFYRMEIDIPGFKIDDVKLTYEPDDNILVLHAKNDTREKSMKIVTPKAKIVDFKAKLEYGVLNIYAYKDTKQEITINVE